GESRSPRLSPGFWFGLEEHPKTENNKKLVVLRVEHEGRTPEEGTDKGSGAQEVYVNRFACVPADVPARPQRPKRRIRQIVENAVVVGPAGEEIHADEHGRVKVQFHWDRDGKGDDHSSCFIRSLVPWAGAA